MEHPESPPIQPRLPELSPRRPQMASGAYYAVLYFDIASFADPVRDSDIQTFVRRGLYTILHTALDEAGIPWDLCYHEDRGDGTLVVAPAGIPAQLTAALHGPLSRHIQRHNKCASHAARIQLRAVLDIGPVYWDDHGVSGDSIIRAARLIEAQPIRDALAATNAALAFAVSEPVYDAVTRHLPDADTYRRIDTKVKQSTVKGWITVSGTHTTALPDGPQLAVIPHSS